MTEPVAAAAPELSIVIPAYNEATRLGSTLAKIVAFGRARFAPAALEILVVDDGSRDATVEVALAHGDPWIRVVRLPQNAGKGAAVKRGVIESRGRLVLISDADLSTPIEDFDKLRPYLAAHPLVFGSRAVRGAELTRRQPFYREWMGKTFNRLIGLAGIRGVTDTQCGFKLLDGGVARRLFSLLTTPGFAFDVELVYLAHRLGYSIAEVGVRWENSPTSRVHVLFDPPKMLLEVLRFRWRHRSLVAELVPAEDNLSTLH